jgi:hypothetical protein
MRHGVASARLYCVRIRPDDEPRYAPFFAAAAAGVTDHVWTMEEIIGMMDLGVPRLTRSG